jgi:acyl-CoA dehydrogenase
MHVLLWLITIFGALGAVSYYRLQLLNATVAMAGALFVGSIIGYVGFFT